MCSVPYVLKINSKPLLTHHVSPGSPYFAVPHGRAHSAFLPFILVWPCSNSPFSTHQPAPDGLTNDLLNPMDTVKFLSYLTFQQHLNQLIFHLEIFLWKHSLFSPFCHGQSSPSPTDGPSPSEPPRNVDAPPACGCPSPMPPLLSSLFLSPSLHSLFWSNFILSHDLNATTCWRVPIYICGQLSLRAPDVNIELSTWWCCLNVSWTVQT